MMKEETAVLSGDELNQRLDEQMLLIERVSILLEDAKLDPNDALAMDRAGMDKLMELLSAYDAFLEHFKDTTEDTVDAIKGLTTLAGNKCCNATCDEDIDSDIDDYDGE